MLTTVEKQRLLSIRYDFLKELLEVCKKHNLILSHEDPEGGFIIEPYNEYTVNWLSDAMIRTHEDDQNFFSVEELK